MPAGTAELMSQARIVDGSIAEMSEASWAGLGAAVGAALTGLFAWLVQRSRGAAEIEVAALAEWQKLYAALSSRVSDLEAELAEVRRAHATEIDEMRRQHRAEMKVLRDQNEGLQNQLIQNSRSTAQLLSESPVTKPRGGPDGK